MNATPESYRMRQSIVVRSWFIGFHKWPQAPDDVGFLRHLHRHVFRIECHFHIQESRQLEFFQVQSKVHREMGLLKGTLEDTPTMSCEQMARFLLSSLISEKLPVFKVVVSEDGENDGVVEIY